MARELEVHLNDPSSKPGVCTRTRAHRMEITSETETSNFMRASIWMLANVGIYLRDNADGQEFSNRMLDMISAAAVPIGTNILEVFGSILD